MKTNPVLFSKYDNSFSRLDEMISFNFLSSQILYFSRSQICIHKIFYYIFVKILSIENNTPNIIYHANFLKKNRYFKKCMYLKKVIKCI